MIVIDISSVPLHRDRENLQAKTINQFTTQCPLKLPHSHTKSLLQPHSPFRRLWWTKVQLGVDFQQAGGTRKQGQLPAPYSRLTRLYGALLTFQCGGKFFFPSNCKQLSYFFIALRSCIWPVHAATGFLALLLLWKKRKRCSALGR